MIPSGPRSSSIITQGNIDQVINYKPIERKIILEEQLVYLVYRQEEENRNSNYNLQT